MFKIKQFIFNPFEESTFVLIDEGTRKAAVVDPGMFTDKDYSEFDKFIADNNLQLVQIINTHLHVDHCFGDNYVRDKYNVKVAANLGDAPFGSALVQQAARFGIRKNVRNVEIDISLNDGDIIKIGESRLEVIQVPGHSQGGIALYCKEQNFLIAGDSLFRGSIGRTDLEGGNHQELVDNVKNKLLTLPPETAVLPGHGPFTTIGHEQATNPYLQ